MAEEQIGESTGLARVIALAVAGLLVGHFTAVGVLLQEEVPVVIRESEIDKVPSGKAYLLRPDRSRAPSWRGKAAAWENARIGELRITEAELNNWAEEQFAAKAAAAEEPGRFGFLRVEASPAQFRIREGKLQVSTEVKLPGLPGAPAFLYQVHGSFERRGNEWAFVAERSNLGQAPVAVVPGLRDWVFSWMRGRFAETAGHAWLEDQWQTIGGIDLLAGEMRLTRRSED